MKKRKYAEGGLSDAEEKMMAKGLANPYDPAKKKLPSESISPLEKTPRANLVDRATAAVKGVGQRLKDNVMGTKEQNAAAEAREKAQAKADPNSNQAKFRKMMGKDEFKSGGSVRSSASKRADGCAIRGKTRA